MESQRCLNSGLTLRQRRGGSERVLAVTGKPVIGNRAFVAEQAFRLRFSGFFTKVRCSPMSASAEKSAQLGGTPLHRAVGDDEISRGIHGDHAHGLTRFQRKLADHRLLHEILLQIR